MTAGNSVRATLLAVLVVLSVLGGSVAFAGPARGAASSLSIVSEQPVAGSGNVTVEVNVDSGANVSFKLEDSTGAISGTKTVTDGGSADRAALDGVVRTTLDLGRLYESEPASGTGIIYAGQGDGFSIAQQGYTTKVQVAIDADAPTANVTSGASAQAGDEVKVGYTATDVPQKVESITMRVVKNGTVYKTVTGLQTGENTAAQFVVPSGLSAGKYNITLTVVDEVGHTATDTLVDGLVVEPSDGSGGTTITVGALEVKESQPVSGTEKVRVTVTTPNNVTFKVRDASGRIGKKKTVTDGGPADLAETSGIVVTHLNLSRMFGEPAASGTAHIYAGKGDSFSIANQTYETKRQLAVDGDPPTAAIESGGTAWPGAEVSVTYSATDVPQKVSSITLKVVRNGTVYTTISNLQVGSDRVAQFVVPTTMSPGEYNLTLVVVDEVGHRTTATLEDGLVVEPIPESSITVGGLSLVGPQTIAGSANRTVEATVTPGANATFRIQDASGEVSEKRVVTDGGPADRAAASGVVRAALNLTAMFDGKPASGTALVYAAGGDDLDVANQTYEVKQQFAIDSQGPTANVTGGAKAEAGQQVKITYDVTDVPEKVRSVKLLIIGSDGLIYERIPRLQGGEGSAVQFIIPTYVPPGEYDVKVVAVDEVGHRTTDTLQDGLVVEPGGTSSNDTVSASALEVRSDQPVKGTGDVVVGAELTTVGGNVTFQVQGPAGEVSRTKTVTDGGPGDQADRLAAVVVTTLDLSDLFETKPESGTAIVYAGGGDSFSIENQTYDTKRQVALDSDPPTANVTDGGTARPGTEVKVGYSATDEPQKVRSITLKVVKNGTVYKTVTGLQVGKGRTVEFVVPWDLSPGKYDLKLVVVDEVGHRTTDTLVDGLVVREIDST